MQQESAPAALTVDVGRAIRWTAIVCISIELLLVLLDGFIAYGALIPIRAIQRLVNITREDSLCNWFSSTQLLFVGLVLWLVFVAVKQQGGSRMRVLGWGLLACFFSYMALDDGSMLHERIGTAARDVLDDPDAGPSALERFPSYAWQAVLGPFFVGMGIFMAIFLWREVPERSQRLVLLFGIGCYAVAMGLDFFEEVEGGPYEWLMRTFSVSRYTVSHFSKSLEETLENFGTTLFLLAFMRRLSRHCESIRLIRSA